MVTQAAAAAVPPLSVVTGSTEAPAMFPAPTEAAAVAAAGTPPTGVQPRNRKKRKIAFSPVALAPACTTQATPSSPTGGGIPQTDGAEEDQTTPPERSAREMAEVHFRPPPPPPLMTCLTHSPWKVLCMVCSTNHHLIQFCDCIECHLRKPVPMFILRKTINYLKVKLD